MKYIITTIRVLFFALFIFLLLNVYANLKIGQLAH